MLPGFHLVSNGITGYVAPDGKCLPCPARCGRAAVLCHGDHKLFPGANIRLKNFPVYNPRRVSFTCKASSSSHTRNPNISRQHKRPSRGKSRQFQERESSENLEESDVLHSKNGPVISVSSNQRYQATPTPGRRENDIVELFRKVQAQLRARAAIKEEKKTEASQPEPGERGTVDSLLNLLRNHSMDQGKKSGLEEDSVLDQPEGSNPFADEQNPNFFRSISSEEVRKPEPVTFSRPASNFSRKSPIPRVKFQPVLSVVEDGSSNSCLKSQKKKSGVDEQDEEPGSLDGTDETLKDDPCDTCATDDTEETRESSATLSAELGSLKLSELKGLAKSRGIKGYSKLKKVKLVELLSAESLEESKGIQS